MSAVFISHASRDAAAAHAIVAALEAHGIACWISARDVAPGANYQEAIVTAIRSGRAMVVLVSEAANASDEVDNARNEQRNQYYLSDDRRIYKDLRLEYTDDKCRNEQCDGRKDYLLQRHRFAPFIRYHAVDDFIVTMFINHLTPAFCV